MLSISVNDCYIKDWMLYNISSYIYFHISCSKVSAIFPPPQSYYIIAWIKSLKTSGSGKYYHCITKHDSEHYLTSLFFFFEKQAFFWHKSLFELEYQYHNGDKCSALSVFLTPTMTCWCRASSCSQCHLIISPLLTLRNK